MIKVTNKQIGILECFFGIIFLILSIVAIIYTVNAFQTEAINTINLWDTTLAVKYNISLVDQSDTLGLGFPEGMKVANLSGLSEAQLRSYYGDFLSFGANAKTTLYSIFPIFVLASICALAISFIMIFQGIYHWNKE